MCNPTSQTTGDMQVWSLGLLQRPREFPIILCSGLFGIHWATSTQLIYLVGIQASTLGLLKGIPKP